MEPQLLSLSLMVKMDNKAFKEILEKMEQLQQLR